MRGRVLIIAGSDSGGGAGIQADIKAVTVLKGYAMTAVAALTAQDTLGVHGVLPVPPDFVAWQMRLCLDDIGADAIKTGMLATAAVVEAVADTLEGYEGPPPPAIIDPVMVAKGGAALLEGSAASALIARLLPLAALLTPNAEEAASLTGLTLTTPDDLRRAADKLQALGARAVLMKGGHIAGDTVVDLLRTGEGEWTFTAPRQAGRHTHGTGCTLASAIACGVAQGLALPVAVARAHSYVQGAIRSAPGFGRGHGPLDHAHAIADFPAPRVD